MDARTVADVEGWQSRPFDGGFDGLHALAAGEFSGAIVADDSYLFMVRGRVVGVFDYAESAAGDASVEPADVDRFEDAGGTAYEAPHEALALLFAMAASGGETRGRYYSNDTPLEEVDRTLRDGGFTGYLELSENVLSGDYYLIYHGGRRRSVAFVGQSRRLKTDEEAFDLASDEVGIYEVTAVPLSTVEIPGSPGPGGAAAVPDAGSGSTGDGDADASGPHEDAPGDPTETTGTTESTETTGAVGTTESESEATGGPEIDLDAAMNPRTAEEDETGTGMETDTETETEAGAPGASPPPPLGGTADDAADPGSGDRRGRTDRDEADDSEGSGASDAIDFGEILGTDDAEDGSTVEAEGGDEAETGDEVRGTGDAAGSGSAEAGAAGAPDARATDTPDGTPDEAGEGGSTVESAVSAVPDDETVGPGEGLPDPSSFGASSSTGEATPEDVEAAAAAAEAAIEDEDVDEDEDGAETDRSDHDAGSAETETESGTTADPLDDERVVPSVDPDRTAQAPRDGAPGGGGPQVIDGETVAGLRSELSAREERIEELRERLRAVEAARADLETERDELAERVAELERRLAESGAAPLENTREMSPAEALSGTSVLVRYRSKSEPTLAEAHVGEATRDSLAANLVLEPHTTFETDGLSVGGRTYEAFLEGSQGYAFLRWLAAELLYEIRDTGNVTAMEPLYDALPTLDRVEFDAVVTLEGADREATRFDLVGRNRRGDPLFVAHLEDDRAPTNAATVGQFLTEATAAAESHESLVAAFAVTASYFEPEALSTAEDATGGSLLSRSKRESFVNTSRKGGYHLCLVEDREESFYLSVPDL